MHWRKHEASPLPPQAGGGGVESRITLGTGTGLKNWLQNRGDKKQNNNNCRSQSKARVSELQYYCMFWLLLVLLHDMVLLLTAFE